MPLIGEVPTTAPPNPPPVEGERLLDEQLPPGLDDNSISDPDISLPTVHKEKEPAPKDPLPSRTSARQRERPRINY